MSWSFSGGSVAGCSCQYDYRALAGNKVVQQNLQTMQFLCTSFCRWGLMEGRHFPPCSLLRRHDTGRIVLLVRQTGDIYKSRGRGCLTWIWVSEFCLYPFKNIYFRWDYWYLKKYCESCIDVFAQSYCKWLCALLRISLSAQFLCIYYHLLCVCVCPLVY